MPNDKYKQFVSLHNGNEPLILYNCWNAATAKLADKYGSAVATSSYAIAASLGYEDGERMPFSLLLEVIKGMAKNVEKPLTVDMETGYGASSELVLQNILALLELGVVGINLEDQIIGAKQYTLLSMKEQCAKIADILTFAQSNGYTLFINARTDIFFMETEHTQKTADDALERCHAYHKAGARCMFMPGLTDIKILKYIAARAPLPLNVMVTDPALTITDMVQAGVKRISYGPLPYFWANNDFEMRMQEAVHDNR